MSRHNINGRLAALEQRAGGHVDLAVEAAEFGGLQWSLRGGRCYVQQTETGSRLAVVGGSTLVYELVGVDVRDLV